MTAEEFALRGDRWLVKGVQGTAQLLALRRLVDAPLDPVQAEELRGHLEAVQRAGELLLGRTQFDGRGGEGV